MNVLFWSVGPRDSQIEFCIYEKNNYGQRRVKWKTKLDKEKRFNYTSEKEGEMVEKIEWRETDLKMRFLECKKFELRRVTEKLWRLYQIDSEETRDVLVKHQHLWKMLSLHAQASAVCSVYTEQTAQTQNGLLLQKALNEQTVLNIVWRSSHWKTICRYRNFDD